MTSQTPDMQSVLERLEKLERQNRWLKRLGVLGFLVACAVLLMAQTKPQNVHFEKVEARQFVLRDAAGRARAYLDAQDSPTGVAGLTLYGGDGKLRAALTLQGNEPSVVFYDARGPRAGFSASGLTIRDTNLKLRLALQLYERGPSLNLYDGESEIVPGAMLDLTDDGPRLMLYNTSDSSMAYLSAYRNQPSLRLIDEQKYMAALGTVDDLMAQRNGEVHNKTSAASLVMFDKDKNIIWRAP